MTRLVHDQFAKQYFSEVLNLLGEVEISKEITSEVRQIDIFFIPGPDAAAKAEQIGVLGRLAAKGAAGFEVFRNAVEKKEIRECMGKMYDYHSLLDRQARREKRSIEEAEFPHLWILTPTMSDEILQGLPVKPDTENGMNGILSGRMLKNRSDSYSSTAPYPRNNVVANSREGYGSRASNGRTKSTPRG